MESNLDHPLSIGNIYDSVGHKGRFGHEFLEFEIHNDGRFRYANNSRYKNDIMIRKEMYVSRAVIEEFQKAIEDSEVAMEDDSDWPEANADGSQELEVILDDVHICFSCSKINSLMDLRNTNDPDGLRVFYYAVQDLKCLAFALINMHFKIKPIPL